MRHTVPSHHTGFTLVELSIVLVIIGLIVGGVLVGQDMIKAAELRATVAQIEKYNAAVNTFRDKYNGFPGDLLYANTNFGLTTRTGANGHGDGDGLYEGCSSAATALGCETGLFWVDLSGTNLIDGAFTTATDALVDGTAGAFNIDNYEPLAKVGRGNHIGVYTLNGLNYYFLSGISSVSNMGVVTTSSALTPQQAFNIDLKMDDGKPGTGVSLAYTAYGTAATNSGADRKSKSTFAALVRRQLGSALPSAPHRVHGASRTPSAARQPRQRAPAPGVERPSMAPWG
jgi:prepilin-type N-terminal cleavage/methylation domain-containing protein